MSNQLFLALLSLTVSSPLLASETLTSLVGDKDGFGIGIQCGDYYPNFNAFTDDPSDPYGTDHVLVASSYVGALPHPNAPNAIYPPAPLIHDFELPASAEILSATLRLCTADIDDANLFVDDQLFLDGIEVPGAFDDVWQYASGPPGYSGMVVFELDAPFFPYILDGLLEVLIDETGRFTTEPTIAEGFAIDYSELAVVYVAAPTLSCAGFEPPMANYPVTIKKNRALPLKAQVADADGHALAANDLDAPPVVQVLYDSGLGGDPLDVTEDALSAGMGTEGNQFVFTDEGYWQFNLKTKNYSAPGTYIVTMESGDDAEYVFDPSCVTEFVIP